MTKIYSDLEKKAAYDHLLEQGVDFDTAIALIQKEAAINAKALFSGAVGAGKRVGAMVGGKAKDFASAVKADAGKVGDQVHNIRQSAKMNGGVFNKGTGSSIKALVKNKAVLTGAAGAAAAGAAAGSAVSGREKQACVQMLMDRGVDFYTAIELTKQAEEDLKSNK